MAIYMLNLSRVSAASGQSSGAKYDYIMREGKYSKDRSEFVASGDAHIPDFCRATPRDFWNAADEHERKNARLCSEFRVALPKELDKAQQIGLVEAFVSKHLIDQPCTWALHHGKGRNPHAHIIFSERKNDPDVKYDREVFFKRNGAKKNRDLNAREWVDTSRKCWAVLANEHLVLSGSSERIDHRSLEDQCKEQIILAAKEFKKSSPDQDFIEQKIRLAESLDREPQEKKRWLRGSGGEAELVSYPKREHRTKRLDTSRLIEELKGMLIMHLVDIGQMVLETTKKPLLNFIDQLQDAADQVSLEKREAMKPARTVRVSRDRDSGFGMEM